MAIDPRFLAESGREVFIGNELLVKGCLEVEGGIHLMTGYPGSPVAGFFDTMGDIGPLLKDKGIRAFQANNEALAAAALNGSQMAPCRSIITMKSVGVHVASDALCLGNLAGAHAQGGAVVIMGDDPWCDSTQVPADSRFICEHLRMPVVEPGSPQQVKDWINLSFKLSQSAGLFIGYIVTTAQADGGGSVDCRPNQYPVLNTNQKIALDTPKIDLSKLLLPPRTWQEELRIPERFAHTIETANHLGLNAIQPIANPPPTAENAPAPLGFIVTGMAGPYLDHVLADIGLLGEFPILQMGMSYPVDVRMVAEFSKLARTMIVIEERRSFLEKNIRDGLFHVLPHEQASDIAGRLFGKKFPTGGAGIPETRGLNPSLLATILIPLIKATEDIAPELRNGRLTAELDTLRKASKPRLDILGDKLVARTPTFCPGCPHRDSSATLLELRKNLNDPKYMKKQHDREPVDLVAHGDTGCYTMLMFAPTEQLMHNYSGMGLGGGTGTGIDPFITNKQIVFMGDGTFFHSGQIAVSNAIKAGQDITFIILKNDTTAMTGHQEHAGTEIDVLGNQSYVQDIESIVRAMAGTSPLTVDKIRPEDRKEYQAILERTILRDGVKVLIADKECGITYYRREGKAERKTARESGGFVPLKKHMNITPEVCEGCLECTKATACPGLVTVDTDYGRKIDTDLTWCVNDGACERVTSSNDYGTMVKPCPSFEQVTIIRKKRKRYTLPNLNLDKLPEAEPIHDMSKPGDVWRVHMAGVGGMGIGVVGAILVRAGHKEGYRVIFSDKKGLAIRNGGVFSQIAWVKDDAVAAEESSATEPTPSAEQQQLEDAGHRRQRNTDVLQPSVSHAHESTSLTPVLRGEGQRERGSSNTSNAGIRDGLPQLDPSPSIPLPLSTRGEGGSHLSQSSNASDPLSRVGTGEGEGFGSAGATDPRRPSPPPSPRVQGEGGSNASALGNSRNPEVLSRAYTSEGVRNAPRLTYPTTGTIPYGRADLLLGIDILEGARAIDPRENFRVASKTRTSAVLNLHKQPTVYTLLGKDDFDPEKLRDLVYEHVREETSFAKNLSELCEQRLGSKQFVNIMILGIAYQLGLIPISASSLGWAIRDTIRRDQRKNIKAFNIGRKLALEPRVLPRRPEPMTWQQLVTNKTRILRRHRYAAKTAEAFEKLVSGAMAAMPNLPEKTKYDLTLRIYDLIQYQNAGYAKRFLDIVRDVYAKDTVEQSYAATHETVWGAAKVMLIKDEPYVAYLLTRYEKKQRDIAKYGIDIANGDRIKYRHATRPEFVIAGKRFRIDISTTDWMLQIARRMKWWRKLPGWHAREVEFREWYIGLAEKIDLSDYGRAVDVLKTTQPVTGYREIRYPKMDEAKRKVEAKLSEPKVRATVYATSGQNVGV